MNRILLSVACFLLSLGTEAQVAKIRSFNAVGVGTPSLLFFFEPAVKSFGTGLSYPTMNAGDLAYSISYKSVRTSGEILMFPCQPDVFSLKAGLDFKVTDRVSANNMDPYLRSYWFGAVHFGYESIFYTSLKGLVFTAGVEFVGYHSSKSYDEFTDDKFYAGIAINSGFDLHLSRKFFLSTDMHLLFGNRWYNRDIKVPNSEFVSEKGNDIVMAVGMPHLISFQLYYIISDFKR